MEQTKTSYTATDIQLMDSINQWLEKHNQTQSWLARLARINASTLNTVLANKYPTSPSKWLNQAQQAIKHFEWQGVTGVVPTVNTSTFSLAQKVCQLARADRTIATFTGVVGTGKTYALRHYTANTQNTYLVEADPGMTVTDLLDDLMGLIDLTCRPGARRNEKFRAITLALKGTDSLLIIDEAETMGAQSLHYVRRLRDKAGIGVVLAGTEHLTNLVRTTNPVFHQTGSRSTINPKTIKGITREDCDALSAAGLADIASELDDSVLDMLWRYTHGSARLLAEGLIPNIRRVLNSGQHQLNASLVDQVARNILNLSGNAA